MFQFFGLCKGGKYEDLLLKREAKRMERRSLKEKVLPGKMKPDGCEIYL